MKRVFSEFNEDINYDNIFEEKEEKNIIIKKENNSKLFDYNNKKYTINKNFNNNVSDIIKLLIKINSTTFIVYGKYRNILFKNIINKLGIIEIDNKYDITINENVEIIYNFEYSNINEFYILYEERKYNFKDYVELCYYINKFSKISNESMLVYFKFKYKYYFKYKVLSMNNKNDILSSNNLVKKINCNEYVEDNLICDNEILNINNKIINIEEYLESLIILFKKFYYDNLNILYNNFIEYINKKILNIEEQINQIYYNVTLKIDNFINDIITKFSNEYLLNTNKIITELKIKKENDYINKFNNFILKIFENIKVDNKERFKFFFEDKNIKFNLFLDKICNNKTITYTYIKNRIINHLDTIKKDYNVFNKMFLQDKILMCDELYNLDNIGKLSILFFNKKNYYIYYNKLI
jgi:hypothetical protein